MERLQSVFHLIQTVQISHVELLCDLLGPLFNNPLEVQLRLLPVRHLTLQKLPQTFNVCKHLFMLLDLVFSLALCVFKDGVLKLLVVLLQILQSCADLSRLCVVVLLLMRCAETGETEGRLVESEPGSLVLIQLGAVRCQERSANGGR